MSGTFTYFAYASNLLAKRIWVNNPSAVRLGTGKIEGYRLTFSGAVSKAWGGCTANILPCEGSTVWGAVWKVGLQDLPNLKRQESAYKAFNVDVENSDGSKVECMTFSMFTAGEEGLPSPAYKNTIVEGAVESELPADYIKSLQSVPVNDYQGEITIYKGSNEASS